MPVRTGPVMLVFRPAVGVIVVRVVRLARPLDLAPGRRAGLDYHEDANVTRHPSWDAFLAAGQPAPDRLFAMTTKGQRWTHDVAFQAGDWLVFGSETQGLPADIRLQIPATQWLKLPMVAGQRSLNLSNAVAVAAYEGWRQLAFTGAAPQS